MAYICLGRWLGGAAGAGSKGGSIDLVHVGVLLQVEILIHQDA